MPLKVNAYFFICFFFLLPRIAFAQETLVFSRPIYYQSMVDSGKRISKIVRTAAPDGSVKAIEFKLPINFRRAIFDSPVNFSSMQADSLSIFSGAKFFSTCDFTSSNFNTRSSFRETTFDSEADFSWTHFKGGVDFCKAQFHAAATFKWTHFHKLFFCSNAQFNSPCNFSGAVFDGSVIFHWTHFKRKIDLQYLTASDKTHFNFSHSVLPDTIDFSHNPFIYLGVPATIDFTVADSLERRRVKYERSLFQNCCFHIKKYFNPYDTSGEYKKIKINLFNTDVSKVKIDYDHFRFYAYDVDNIIYKISNNDVVPQEHIIAIYEGMLKNFKDRGQTDSYEKTDIEYRRLKENLKPDDFSIQDWWWRFGYEKWRIFFHSILFILVFTIGNFYFLDRLNHRDHGIYRLEHFPEILTYRFRMRPQKLSGFLNRFWFSFLYTATVFFLLTLKVENLKFYREGHSFSRFLSTIWILLIYTIGLICMGFIANLILQK